MTYKFAVGDSVEYRPPSSKATGIFQIVRHMPEEFQALDRKYRIKSVHEGTEWNVFECDLSTPRRSEDSYGKLVFTKSGRG